MITSHLFFILGLPNTSGLLKRKGITAEKDADAITLMKEAGAIPIGLTNCSELCMWLESSNLVYGRCINAYHQGRIVGGSSGKFSFVVTLGPAYNEFGYNEHSAISSRFLCSIIIGSNV